MDRLESFIALNLTNKIGGIRLKSLLEKFGSPERIFKASKKGLESIKGIGPLVSDEIVNFEKKYDLKKEFDLIKEHNIEILTIENSEYPSLLKEIYDPPIVLYIKGELKKSETIVAIVGSRHASIYGLNTAESLAFQLGLNGITIVSGMARGIDSASHRGALKSGGRTVAVLGSGLLDIYPIENKRLAEEISMNGAVVSEFPMEYPPFRQNFPRRNRVISGLSLGVVVVEAAKDSGALITADFALEQGRTVFAVPGKVDSVTSFGTNRLLKQGARLVESAEDILEELGLDRKQRDTKKTPIKLKEDELSIYNTLSSEPLHIDQLTEISKRPVQEVLKILLKLEMKRLVRQLPGKEFVLNADFRRLHAD